MQQEPCQFDRKAKIDFWHRLEAKVFHRHLYLYFFQESAVSREFRAFLHLWENPHDVFISMSNRAPQANVLLVEETIFESQKQDLLNIFKALRWPKFVIALKSPADTLFSRNGKIETASLIPVDCFVNSYMGGKTITDTLGRLWEEEN